ncbi:MAG: GlsB/YeaQ/YmgE family stress response membrane protein [Chloroflexaceae bacterium]
MGQALAGYSLGGLLVSIVVGFIGALPGYWLATGLELPLLLPVSTGGETCPIIWAVIGSAIFAAVVGMLTRRQAHT